MAKTSIPRRQQVTERANGCCEYCMSQQKYASSTFSIEHIQPVAKGGSNKLDNLALASQGCNNYKYTKVTAADIIFTDHSEKGHPQSFLLTLPTS